MPSQPYTRVTERFKVFGIDLNSPPDAIRPGYYNVLENVRSYTEGVVQPRQGLSSTNLGSVIATKTPVHSVRRLNDPNTAAPNNYIRIVGAGDSLAWWDPATNTFTQSQYNAANITFSGNPLTMVPFRPDQAISSWMYLADSLSMYKTIGYNSQSITKGSTHKIGVAPPTTAPTVELGTPVYGRVANLEILGTAPNTWVKDNVVVTTPPSVVARIPAGTTTTRVRYDSSTGWCSIVLPDSAMSVLGIGQFVYAVAPGPTLVTLPVAEIYPKSSVVAVKSILYDTGVTGTCTIQPDQPVKELRRNCVVQLDSVGVNVYARVTETILGQDGTTSFRCSTGASTVATTKTLQVVGSFRSFESGGVLTAGGGDTVTDDGVGVGPGAIFTGGAGTASSKTGWLQITPSASIDLTKLVLPSGLGFGGAITDDDYIHLSLLYSDLSKLVQGRIMFDCGTKSLNISSTATSAGLIQVTTTANHNLATGDTVFINNHNASTNGTWIITVTGATTFTLNGSAFVANAGAVGTVQPQFKDNFYYRAFTPNDLTTAGKGTQTALTNQTVTIGNRNIDHGISLLPGAPGAGAPGSTGRAPFASGSDVDPSNKIRDRIDRDNKQRSDDPNAPIPSGPARSQTGTGDFQWSELRFRRGDLVRFGQDATGGFSKINAFRLELTVTDTTTFTVIVNSLTAWGTSELDVTDLAIPYIYRYRWRVSKTGAVSNWSPASRNGVLPQRGYASVTCTAPTGVPEVDQIDIQRIGGINTTWLAVGSTPIGTLTFSDKIADEAAAVNAPLSEGDINYQPWPTLGKPVSGTTAANGVVGPYIKDSGTNFNLSWAKGTPILINGISTAIRRVVSTSVLEVDDSMGAQTSVSWEIPEPTLLGQSLPALWEWNGRAFACGDNGNPGYLYYSNGNSFDSTQDTNYIEITSPSEPLMNGCSFNGKNYVWSSERMFEIDQIGLGVFIAIPIPGNKGLISRWGLTQGERMWYVSRDGIYQTSGGDSISITDETLKPLFVNEGNAGSTVNGFNAPDLTVAAKVRLSYYDGYLYFNYQDSSGAIRCMVYTPRAEKPGWWPDSYLDGAGITYFYGEEGSGVHSLLACGNDSTTGKLYKVTGTADGAGPIACHLRTQYFDAQDRRADKRWGDLILDADPNNATLNLVAYTNNVTSSSLTLTPTTMVGAARAQQTVDISSGSDPAADFAKNVALDVAWSSSTATPKLYLWEPSYTIRPEAVNLRATSWDDDGFAGDKFFQGIEIETNTQNVARTVQVEYDGGTIAETLTIQHNGQIQKAYPFHPAFIAHMVRLHPTDSSAWEIYKYRWIWVPEPPLADRWESQQTSFGMSGFLHMKAMYVTLRSTDTVTVTITKTDDNTSVTYTIPSTASNRRRVYLPLQVTKGKAFIFVFTSPTAFRLYKDDTVTLIKPWSSEDAFTDLRIWGAPHGDGAVVI